MNRGRYVANSWRLAPGYMYLIGRGGSDDLMANSSSQFVAAAGFQGLPDFCIQDTGKLRSRLGTHTLPQSATTGVPITMASVSLSFGT